MISDFSIRNVAIIDALDTEFHSGMTALTGETGAGKSILVDALMLALGQRADSDLIRHGEDSAEVSVRFEIDALPAVQGWLRERNLDAQECVMRREVRRDGKSRAWINGRPANLSLVQELAALLVTIHSQHSHQQLMRVGEQRKVLDQYVGVDYASLHNAIENCRRIQKERECLSQHTDPQQQLQYLAHQLAELEALSPREEEWEQLCYTHRQQENLGSFVRAANTVNDGLDGDEGICSRLQNCIRKLQAQQQTFPQLAGVIEMLESMASLCQEASSDLAALTEHLELDERALEAIEKRLASWHDLARKHRVDAVDLVAQWRELACRHRKLAGVQERLAALEREHRQAREHYYRQAEQLHQMRQRGAEHFAAEVNKVISKLKLEPRLHISVEYERDHDPNRFGGDRIVFFFQPNPGTPPRPLHKIASGGELSRLSLAMAVCSRGTQPCLIFDEVDVGIGGGVVETVGQLLHQLASCCQVLTITHQAQVAAQSDHHILIHKLADGAHTSICLTVLDEERRSQEIARMIGGLALTQRTLDYATEMLMRS